MQLLLFFSAILTALTGVVTGRVAAPQPVVSASVDAVAPAAAAAVAVVGTLLLLFGLTRLRARPLPRPFNLLPTIAIYLERMRQ